MCMAFFPTVLSIHNIIIVYIRIIQSAPMLYTCSYAVLCLQYNFQASAYMYIYYNYFAWCIQKLDYVHIRKQ